jgi:integrase
MRALTDRALKAAKEAKAPYEIADGTVSNLFVRVMPTGVKSFVLYRRFPGAKNPVRRSLGRYGELSLSEARDKARIWLELIGRGVDPSKEEERRRRAAIEAERVNAASTFEAAFSSYIYRKASKLRSGKNIEGELKRECAAWMAQPLTAISQRHVKELIGGIVARGHETQAHTIFGMLRTFFNWLVDDGQLDSSPCKGIKPIVLIGERNIRDRLLKDYEVAAFWHTCEVRGYPFGKLAQLLLMTALRRDEVAEAQWSEINFENRLWIIPPKRMKGTNQKARAHAVPLTEDLIQFLDALPRFAGGDFIFSTTAGRKPVSGFSKAKKRLDALMKVVLEARGLVFEDFILHDLRRVCRTKFSSLPIEDVVRELLLSHVQPVLRRTYDIHSYQEEKRHALTLWHQRLRTIVEPRQADLIPLPLAR